MLRKLTFKRRSEYEELKEQGMHLDFDEIARKGAMSSDEKNIAKWYGIYGSRHPGTHMARVVIPGGVISTSQARNIAQVAEDYGQGRLNITTRQALQFHWLKASNLADMMRDLNKEHLTTMHGCGDVTRNIAACPLAESCQYARLNVLPWTRKAAKYLGDAKDLEDLPRKFKVTFSGCGAACAQPYMNCVGNIAVERKTEDGKTEKGFKVVIGGGMGWKAFVAEELFSFVPEHQILEVTRAIALLFRDHGDRFDRTKSRLKYVVHRYGIEKCREIVLDFLKLEGRNTENLIVDSIVESGIPYPERPLTEEDPKGTDGLYTVRIFVPKGELGFRDFAKIAELSDIYGDQNIYTTNRQNLEIHGVELSKVPELKKEIHTLGYKTGGSFGMHDIVSCVGTTYCPKAVSETRKLYDAVAELVKKDTYAEIEKKVLFNITGCPNSCSPYRIVDIGFRGMRIREEQGSVEGFELLIGGHEQKHGQKIGDFKFADCIEVVETILDHFLSLRQKDETLTQTVNRIGIDPFKKAVFDEV